MTLTSRNGKRKFKIFDNNWYFLMGLLSNDMKSDTTLFLAEDRSLLNSLECNLISHNIKRVIHNYKIFEHWDGIKVEPIINPTAEILERYKNNIQPLTFKRRNFLLSLANFVSKSKELYIMRDKQNK